MHPETPVRQPASRLRGLPAIHACALVVLALASCGPATPSAPPTPLPATTRPGGSVAATSAPGTTSPSAAPTTTTLTFDSAAYRYTIRLPAGWTVTAARTPWDGSAQINSDGPYVDRFTGPAGELFFVYAAPTALGLQAFAADQQAKVAIWHGCPAEPSAESDQVVRLASGGEALARLHGFPCVGLSVYKLMSVANGIGIVLNEIRVPVDEATLRAEFLSRVAAVTWMP